jgi:hypothetical protein
MSGRTMPLSSRTDMVLCTSDRKKFTTEFDINLMWSNCVHGTENKYCKWHNILSATHIFQELVKWPELSLKKYALARNGSSSVFCCLVFVQEYGYFVVLLQISLSSSVCLFSLCWKLEIGCAIWDCNSNKKKILKLKGVSDIT